MLFSAGWAVAGMASMMPVIAAPADSSTATTPRDEPILVAQAPAAEPQAGSDALGEIIVTSRRKQELSQDVPISLVAFSGQSLEQSGIRSLADISAVTPGLFTTPGSTHAGAAPVYSIRGQLNRDPSATADPSIGIYFADVPWARDAGSDDALPDPFAFLRDSK